MPYCTIEPEQRRIFYYSSQHAKHAGTGSIAVVMIHGLGASQNFYLPVIDVLQSTKFHFIAPDTYGTAHSQSSGEEIQLDSLADDVMNVLDSLNVHKAVVVGHSIDGLIACIVAAKYPDRVIRLVCIGPLCPRYLKADAFTSRINIVEREGMEAMANQIPHSATDSSCSSLSKAIVRGLILNQAPEGYASHCRAITAAIEPNYTDISVPVLFIIEEEDNSAPYDGCKFMSDHLSSKEKSWKVLKECVTDIVSKPQKPSQHIYSNSLTLKSS